MRVIILAGVLGFKPGAKVRKVSGKPFKSGKRMGTIKELTVNPDSGKPAIVLREDDSIVDIYRCKLVMPFNWRKVQFHV
jgi:hypothetical protein